MKLSRLKIAEGVRTPVASLFAIFLWLSWTPAGFQSWMFWELITPMEALKVEALDVKSKTFTPQN